MAQSSSSSSSSSSQSSSSSRKTSMMKWTAYIKEKVGISPRHPSSSSSPSSSSTPFSAHAPSLLGRGGQHDHANSSSDNHDNHANPRGKNDPELDFKKFWEVFLASSSEKEKETALNMALDIFCSLARQQANIVELVSKLVGAHIFSFAIGRAFVSNIEKLRIHDKTKSLNVGNVTHFFSTVTEDGTHPGSNLLYVVEVLVSGVVDKQPLLDSGILCCLIHIFNALLVNTDDSQKQISMNLEESILTERAHDNDLAQVHQIEVEGSIVHIIKALANHPSAAISITEDNSLEILFQMVANGSMTAFSRYKNGLVPSHVIQLYRHAIQILGLLLVNNNGSTATYIHKHHLIKDLLIAVKDFKLDVDDAAYTVGIVDLLLECVELSYKPEAGSIRLREDIHNAHGYQFLVQFALKLSHLQENQVFQSSLSESSSQENAGSASELLDGPNPSHSSGQKVIAHSMEDSSADLCPSLSRLLDVLVSLAQTGHMQLAGSDGGSSSHATFSDKINDDMWEKGNSKVQDLEAIQMLQNIFMKSESIKLQAEVLDRMFRLFLDHIDNYRLCQQIRVMPLFIINMPGIPSSLQEMILKILEYAVTVVNCIPEQELLSLCCLLQQPITSNLKGSILSFFVKLLSFDQQYKKVLWEVGLLEVLINDMLQHKLISGSHQTNKNSIDFERKSSSKSFKKYLDDNNAILSSPRLSEAGVDKFLVFEEQGTVSVAWDCLISLLKKCEANQTSFRSDSGFNIVLPLLVSDVHRSWVLRLLLCLIIEDYMQVYPEELGALIEILKGGMVASVFGLQHMLQNDVKCDILAALWRILTANNSAKRVFAEATGFSLLLTILHSFHSDGEHADFQSIANHMKVFSFLLRVMTAAVCDNAINRLRLHTILSSQTFCDLLCESRLICEEWEVHIIQLLLELALEIVLPPSNVLQGEREKSLDSSECGSGSFFSNNFLGVISLDVQRVYNAGAVAVLIRSLLLFTPKVQLELLLLVEKLASTGSFNQENLTSIGCVGLLLETISPFLTGSSPLLIHSLRIVEVLGAYKLSTLELRLLVRYILQMKSLNSGHYLVDMMEKLIQTENVTSENVSLAPYVEMDMSKVGYASIQVSLGERTWPPASGYSFVCWFQYHNLFKRPVKEKQQSKDELKMGSDNALHSGEHVLHFFSVGASDIIYAGLFLQDSGVLTLTTNSSLSLSFSGLELEEGRWHHLAVVHSKPNSLTGLFQANVAQVYINGKLCHSGKLGYSPSPAGKSLELTIGTPLTRAKVSNMSWRLRCCYLFEEVLTAGSICFMYILGRGYRGTFQDTDLLQFVPLQACGGGSMAILDSLDAESAVVPTMQILDGSIKRGNHKSEGSGDIWDFDRLVNLSSQLTGKRLIFAFDGTSSEAYGASGMPSLLNLVDPSSSASSSIGGIPRVGCLNGDSFLCHQCVIGDNIRGVGGITVLLALVEAAETRDMLHMALALLASALRQNPQNFLDMQACRGYHLLAIFVRHRMPLFDMQSLDIFFQIAACEASPLETSKMHDEKATTSSTITPESSKKTYFPNLTSEVSALESHGDSVNLFASSDSFQHLCDIESSELPEEISHSVVLSNADMVEHVLLDWTIWITATVSIQLALLGFLEEVVTIPWYRNHNLMLLREINLIQHLLVTLQRDDVEVQVLEKLVVFLGVILEDGFLVTELETVVRFVIMTLDPPESRTPTETSQEAMGKHVIVRNLLLEMLIDLRLAITSEELLEQWHNTLSLKFITFFLDDFVHPTSMMWIITLLGVWLAASPTFAQEFYSSGGYQVLSRVLPAFYEYPEIYYTLFCLIFGKAVYPRRPEVCVGDFYALMPTDGCSSDLNFVELLDSVVAMAKSTFDRLSMKVLAGNTTDTISNISSGYLENQTEETIDTRLDLLLLNGDAASVHAATSVLRFIVDLAKMSPSFSATCRRVELLENCVDLYFSCVRADYAIKMARDLASDAPPDKSLDEIDDDQSVASLKQAQVQSVKNSDGIGSFPHVLRTASSNDLSGEQNFPHVDNAESEGQLLYSHEDPLTEDTTDNCGNDTESVEQRSTFTSNTNEFSFHDSSPKSNSVSPTIPSSSVPSTPPGLKPMSTKTLLPSSSPILALTSWLGSRAINNKAKVQFTATHSGQSIESSFSEVSASPEQNEVTQLSSGGSIWFSINPQFLVEIDASGFGGGQCLAGATSVIDFIAVILADIVLEKTKASQYVESILEAIPLYVDVNTALVFQGLCLGRLINFLERRLLQDNEEDEKKLDKSCWSENLGALCWIIVDHVYMGAYTQPVGVLKVLEFLLSMLSLSNKDGCIEKAIPSGKGLLSMARGTRQLGTYIHALLKSANRMIMYCFLPSFLVAIDEDGFLSRLGFQALPKKILLSGPPQDEPPIDVCSVLQLVFSHKKILFCPSNLDTDLICCLCVNLISLLRDERQTVRSLAVDIFKYLLLHRKATLEELLASKPHQGQYINVLHGGFDLLLTGSSSKFFDWLWRSEQTINIVLDQCAALMWEQYIVGSGKFPGIRIRAMESRRKREMGKKSLEFSKLESGHFTQIKANRNELKLVHDSTSTELRIIRQNKYGWVLHAESEWQTHIQQLFHERGIIPMSNSVLEPEWQLCPIEGPYRMRKKLEHCKFKVESIQTFLTGGLELKDNDPSQRKAENGTVTSELCPDSLKIFSDGVNRNEFDGDDLEDSFFETDKYKGEESISSQTGWIGDLGSSVNEESLHSTQVSIEMSDSMNGKSDIDSPGLSSPMKIDDIITQEKLGKKIQDNGEYLIRPYLEPHEKIRLNYNCERVVGLDKHDGIFLIGDLCLYVIENFYIDDSGCICEKKNEDEPSLIDQALGVKKDVTNGSDLQSKSPSTSGSTIRLLIGGRAWACNEDTWGKKKMHNSGNLPHPWHMWKLDNVSELLKRDYQLRPVAIEIFSTDGCNDLLVFHKKERDKVFKNLLSMNLPRNRTLDDTISGSVKQDNEGSRLFKVMAKSLSKRWQNGEISNFQYLMHLNTLAGRGYSDLTQYPVFPWVLADYESETLDLENPSTFRNFDKTMGCQTKEGEEEFKSRYQNWDDPDVPKFHYGSHYSSAGIVLFYLLRLPPFSTENQKLQGGQFDRADRLFSSIRDTWLSAAGSGNTSDVKELIPEFFYMPEFLENRFNFDMGEKQSGEKVGDVLLPPWAKGSASEFIRKHREALECDYVSENLHHWIDLIFGYKQRGEAAEEAVNVFYHYTYEGNVDIDSILDPAMKASILAQINHFGQTPKQLFHKPHGKRRSDRKIPLHPLCHCKHLLPQEIRQSTSSISQIVRVNEKILVAGRNQLLWPAAYSEYVAWGFPDRSLRFISHDQDKILSTHENLHGGNQIQCAGVSQDSQIMVTGADDGSVAVWRIRKGGSRGQRHLYLLQILCAHTAKITCLYASKPYSLLVTGSDDCSVILWDLSGLAFVRQLTEFPAPVSVVHVNDLTGEIVTAAGILLAVWSVNGDCLATVETSQLPSDLILSTTTVTFSDWKDTNWCVTGHLSGAIKVWNMVHCTSDEASNGNNSSADGTTGFCQDSKAPEYRLVLQKVLKAHKHPVTAFHLTSDLKQLLSGDSAGFLLSWTFPDDSAKILFD